MKMRVLVVDDTILYRKIVSDILSEFVDVEVVGTANNGQIALSRIRTLKPDFLTLDVEMPIMDGLQLLAEIKAEKIAVQCIMVSAKTQQGSEATLKALELGAFDFIAKPNESTPAENKELIKKQLVNIVKALKQQRAWREDRKRKDSGFKSQACAVPKRPLSTPVARGIKSAAVAIGISTGGPNALGHMIPKLKGGLGVPVFVVQHMPPMFTESLAQNLNRKSALTVKEAKDGEEVIANTVYIAPGGRQMKVVTAGTGSNKIIRVSDDPPENNCKPSVDYLFRSVARQYGAKLTCVIMTGMGKDGKLGVAVAKALGAMSIAQDAESCVVYGMPKAVIEAGLVDNVVPLDSLADEIMKTV